MNEKQKINLLIWLAPILGLISELIALCPIDISGTSGMLVHLLRTASPSLSLDFIHSGIFLHYNFDSNLILNYLNLSAYVLLLTGAILYTISRGKEQRLLRTIFVILVLMKAIMLFNTAFMLLIERNILQRQIFSNLQYVLLGIVSNLAWGYAAWYILKVLNRDRVLQTSDATSKGDYLAVYKYVSAPKAQRLANLILDSILCLFICSGMLVYMGRPVLESLSGVVGERASVYVLFIVCRFIYYPFYEIIFGATPAKFLTETRVLSETGEPVTAKTVWMRTLGRHIPFETFSYLGNAPGWHDQFADTIVVKEARTGVSARTYLWILPITITIGLAAWYGNEAYQDHLSYEKYKTEYDYKMNALEAQLTHLSENTVIELGEYYENYGKWTPCLKVQNIKGDSITFQYLYVQSNYNKPERANIEYSVSQAQGLAAEITMHRSELQKGYEKNYDQHLLNSNGKLTLNDTSAQYIMLNVSRIYEPSLKIPYGTSYGNGQVYIPLENEGTPADLVVLESLEGKAIAGDELPQRLDRKEYRNIIVDTKLGGSVYKIKLILKDQKGQQYQYLLEGKDRTATISQLFK